MLLSVRHIQIKYFSPFLCIEMARYRWSKATCLASPRRQFPAAPRGDGSAPPHMSMSIRGNSLISRFLRFFLHLLGTEVWNGCIMAVFPAALHRCHIIDVYLVTIDVVAQVATQWSAHIVSAWTFSSPQKEKKSRQSEWFVELSLVISLAKLQMSTADFSPLVFFLLGNSFLSFAATLLNRNARCPTPQKIY